MPNFMEFERPIVELKNKISEFKKTHGRCGY